MIKYPSLFVLLVFLTGCAGDRLTFHQEGDATVDKNRICITSSPGDTLEYYSLSSSENNHKKPLAMEDGIVRRYPDTCIPLPLKGGTNYELLYVLSGQYYRFEFITDDHKKVTKTYSKP
ncbi:putative T6SS immunity periplasmic lipoprotein [Serratia sp. MYb239]|uniref:putative T6SS immunity periplasmic lipoprotein n=1 Tax=Serratia sp. MYb239 TaxID=2033438 RepID=UPI00131A3CD6|nr:putative T6SS immunity periplasmic lipoprotein [Serratia sp. MYb239]